ncbi:MAG: hypothetical protein K1X68_11405 [Saprospiraceae bacterium]|nr:hypothetical protein [Saprospiraceae bacterium]
MRKKNPDYRYEFYDDQRMNEFMHRTLNPEAFELFCRIQIGALKADFFRYVILYHFGGVYLDIDSLITAKLDTMILPGDHALISKESNGLFYIQYALFFEAGHPFLQRTIQMLTDNLRNNRFPHDGHSMTGPGVYTHAIRSCLEENPLIHYRELPADYNGDVIFSYPMSKLFLYGPRRKGHWKKASQKYEVLKSK